MNIKKFDQFCKNQQYQVAFIQFMAHSINQIHQKTRQGLYQNINNLIQQLLQHHINKYPIETLAQFFKLCIRKGLKKFKTTKQLDKIRSHLVQICEQLVKIFENSKWSIVKEAKGLINYNQRIMTIGYSQRLYELFLQKSQHTFHLIICQESQQTFQKSIYSKLPQSIINISTIKGTQIGNAMSSVDKVIVAPYLVMENGGILAKIGTSTMAMCAKALNKPFYVMCESFRFSRKILMDCNDITGWQQLQGARCEYTSPEYIELIYSDLGVMNTSAVCDKLMEIFK